MSGYPGQWPPQNDPRYSGYYYDPNIQQAPSYSAGQPAYSGGYVQPQPVYDPYQAYDQGYQQPGRAQYKPEETIPTYTVQQYPQSAIRDATLMPKSKCVCCCCNENAEYSGQICNSKHKICVKCAYLSFTAEQLYCPMADCKVEWSQEQIDKLHQLLIRLGWIDQNFPRKCPSGSRWCAYNHVVGQAALAENACQNGDISLCKKHAKEMMQAGYPCPSCGQPLTYQDEFAECDTEQH